MNPNQWWEDFYPNFFSKLQDQVRDQERTLAEVDWILKAGEIPPQARILDVPCGVGRHSVELARRGYQVVGIDFSEPILERAKEAVAAAGVEVEIRQEDMRELAEDGGFQAVVCYWGSFGYFPDAENLDFARRAFRALDPGGVFVIDTKTLESFLTHFQPTGVWPLDDDREILEKRRYDPLTGRAETQWILIEDGPVEARSSSIRRYSIPELTHLLKEAGFATVEFKDPHTEEDFTMKSRRATVIARKA